MITVEEIQNDIREFEEQIHHAQQALAGLPLGRLPYPDHKRREQRRRELTDDIIHINRLIGYAQEGLGKFNE